MSRRGGRALDRARGFFLVLALLVFSAALGLLAGIAAGGDVASAEAHGELGLAGSGAETPMSGAPTVLAEEGGGVPWLETAIYLVAASLALAGYALAARRWPWLRRQRRKS